MRQAAEVMKAAAKVGDSSRARWWFETGRNQTGMAMDTTSCTILVSAAKESKDLNTAEALYQEFLQTGRQPNFQLLSAIIATAANARQPKKAAMWLDEMKRLGLKPNHKSYASLMNAWFKTANSDMVLKTLEDMKCAGLGSEVTVVDYTMAIKSVGMAGRRADAEHLIRDMLVQQVNPNERTLKTLESAVGAQRCFQLIRELKLDLRMDKFVDQSAREIARNSRDIARHTNAAALKAKLRSGRCG